MSLDLIRDRAPNRSDVLDVAAGSGLDGLYLAHNKERQAEMARMAMLQRGMGRGM